MQKYTHKENVHNLKAPRIIVPEIIKLFDPKSVVDIGCGIGTFLHEFKRLGVSNVLGVDGPWTNKELLFKHIQQDEFLEFDLEKDIKLPQRYDLVVSLEVAEHLKEESADLFIHNLVNSGDIILFSAAIPNQGGQNHINEQWLTYWEKIFAKYNYVLHDIIRPIFWDNKDVDYWYKQNMVIMAPDNLIEIPQKVSVPMRNIVHYELLERKSEQLQRKINQVKDISMGKENASFYIKGLIKSIIGYKNV
jgi:2-polyprenyl-3-methyl-5-hydroxy-6-metoxy-1,4-benzoquinol methylase